MNFYFYFKKYNNISFQDINTEIHPEYHHQKNKAALDTSPGDTSPFE